MAMLTLNGAALPDPSALSVELQDALLSARRTLSGAASVSRAAVKRRVRCYWAHMPAAQLAAMLSALAGSAVVTAVSVVMIWWVGFSVHALLR